MDINDLKLCLLTHPNGQSFQQYLCFIKQTIEGGITAIQFRDKTNHKFQRYRYAQQLRDLLTQYDIPFIVNDDVELAKAVEADGLHLGQTDCSPQKAREQLPDLTWIGLSIETMQQLNKANQLNCINYVAASAVFQSKTKTNCKTYWGLNGLNKVIKHSTFPVIAIGGIDLSHVQAIMKLGTAGIALISAIHQAQDPQTTAQQFKQLVSKEYL